MTRHALELLLDAESIKGAELVSGSQGRGAYLLELIAVEILLKANALKEAGELPWGHEVPDLFRRQPKDLRERVRSWYDTIVWVKESDEHDVSLQGQLATLTENFKKFRYHYERSFPYTARENAERERAFVAGETAGEMLFHRNLLDRLIEELLADLRAFRPPGLPSVRWEKGVP